jgi:hypothetical protein
LWNRCHIQIKFSVYVCIWPFYSPAVFQTSVVDRSEVIRNHFDPSLFSVHGHGIWLWKEVKFSFRFFFICKGPNLKSLGYSWHTDFDLSITPCTLFRNRAQGECGRLIGGADSPLTSYPISNISMGPRLPSFLSCIFYMSYEIDHCLLSYHFMNFLFTCSLRHKTRRRPWQRNDKEFLISQTNFHYPQQKWRPSVHVLRDSHLTHVVLDIIFYFPSSHNLILRVG